MSIREFAEVLGPELSAAFEAKGYTQLSAVQRAVLDEALRGRDLRITSQTGSGKTVAIGLSLRELAKREAPPEAGVARPLALIVAPTRELAHQVEQELRWLYAGSGTRLASTTGGASYRDEHRTLSRGPVIVVGTPGRLLDHLRRGAIDGSKVEALVLDEADRMLDLGFRADLDAIFSALPDERRTHLVSATFPRAVRSLADAVQREPAMVEGTRLGEANADIDHVIHVVPLHQRLDALINLLLAYPDEQTLVFVRTRADASELANELVTLGFAASGLSGEMEQAARSRTLAAFKRGGLRVLVATDVAARGIDVQDVTRVVHAEPPNDADSYTHRAGRTGRAGRKGTSSLLVAPAAVTRATRFLRGMGVAFRFDPIPSAEEIWKAQDERIFAELTAPVSSESEELAAESGDGDLQRFQALAERLVEFGSATQSLARLLARAHSGPAPRHVDRPAPPKPRDPELERRPSRPLKHRTPRYDARERSRSDSPRAQTPSRSAAPTTRKPPVKHRGKR